MRGALSVENSAVPARGALVTLLRPDGLVAASTRSNEAGRFVLAAPGAGTYRLRVERVGFRTFTGDAFALAAGETRDLPLALPAAAVTLEGLHVTGERRCRARGRDGAALQRVWDEARKALRLTQLATADTLLAFDFVMFERDVALDHRTVLRDSTWRRTVAGALPFASLPADSLARVGFVEVRADSGFVMHYAPDAAVLLSASFMDGHCFGLRRGGRDRPGMVGLTFEPAEQRHVAGVRGVLWLEARSAELRELEFAYTGVDTRRLGVHDRRMDHRMGGRVRFLRLPTGAWIVRDWTVRWPLAQMQYVVTTRRLALAPALRGIRETGGNVLEARPVTAPPP